MAAISQTTVTELIRCEHGAVWSLDAQDLHHFKTAQTKTEEKTFRVDPPLQR